MKPDIELFEKVKKVILKEPGLFAMDHWADTGFCGTTHCIGGWAVILKYGIGPTEEDFENAFDEWHDEVWDRENRHVTGGDFCAKALGIRNHALFYTQDWPEELEYEYRSAISADDFELMAEVAVKAIDNFLETNEWSDEKNV